VIVVRLGAGVAASAVLAGWLWLVTAGECVIARGLWDPLFG